MSQDEIEELESKALCFRCVGEPYLRKEISRRGQVAECSYCGRRGRSYTIGDLADRVAEAFEEHYERTSDQPDELERMAMADEESRYDWERGGYPIAVAIADAANIDEVSAEDIQTVLEDRHGDFDLDAIGEETEFSSETYYEERGPDDSAWREEWEAFVRSLQTEARFFNVIAAGHLTSVFQGLADMATRDGRLLVVEAGPGTELTAVYRARVFQSDGALQDALCRPDQHLGPPPSRLANAGRMNAKGISVFYGASDVEVAIAEVRPPVGSQVAVARFEILRPLRLLDLTALREVHESGSIFDPTYAQRLAKATFLQSLTERMTRPVMPDDEAFDYLPTQVVADFLATQREPWLDGILFPSAQIPGEVLNVVLFQKASRVEELELPAGTKVSARTGELHPQGWEPGYAVSESVPATPPAKAKLDDDWAGEWVFGVLEFGDPREVTLRVDTDAVGVHLVKAVKVETAPFEVRRYRWERSTDDF